MKLPFQSSRHFINVSLKTYLISIALNRYVVIAVWYAWHVQLSFLAMAPTTCRLSLKEWVSVSCLDNANVAFERSWQTSVCRQGGKNNASLRSRNCCVVFRGRATAEDNGSWQLSAALQLLSVAEDTVTKLAVIQSALLFPSLLLHSFFSADIANHNNRCSTSSRQDVSCQGLFIRDRFCPSDTLERTRPCVHVPLLRVWAQRYRVKQTHRSTQALLYKHAHTHKTMLWWAPQHWSAK